jgi:hypothetical protein
LEDIQAALAGLGIAISEDFLNIVSDNGVFALRVFDRQLWDVFLAKDPCEYSSFKLWVEVLNSLENTKLNDVISKLISQKSVSEEDIQRITNDYRISPALLLMLRFFKTDAKIK